MKSIILGLAMLCGASVFAAQKDCTPYIVANGEAAGEYVYPCGSDRTVTYHQCINGEVSYTSVMDPTGNFYQQVPVVCKNGTFAQASGGKALKTAKCKKGEVAYDTVMGASGEFVNVTIVCKGGRFVRGN